MNKVQSSPILFSFQKFYIFFLRENKLRLLTLVWKLQPGPSAIFHHLRLPSCNILSCLVQVISALSPPSPPPVSIEKSRLKTSNRWVQYAIEV